MGKDWRDIFDVIIVQARKPKFFTDCSRPFRLYDPHHKMHSWDKVHALEKGRIYYEVGYQCIKIHYSSLFILDSLNSFRSNKGTVKQLQEMTGWKGERVLYFGDHPYSDLADASLMHGWRTGAIIKELTVSRIMKTFKDFK